MKEKTYKEGESIRCILVWGKYKTYNIEGVNARYITREELQDML